MVAIKAFLFTMALCICLRAGAQFDSLYLNAQVRDGITKTDETVSCQRQIITAEQIRLSGFNRLSDVFQLIDAATFSSINGDRWYLQLNGSASYTDQSWILMINGQRIPLSRCDAVHVNMTGISITEIDRIEVVNSPGFYLGEFSDKGIIHIITKKSTNGISYRGYYNEGNETGDPGFYRFTPGATDNVDKIGLNYTHVLGYRSNKWSINTAYVYQDYFFRDTIIFNRVRRHNPPASKSNLVAARFELNYSGAIVKQQVQGNITEANDFLYDPVTAEHQANTRQYNGAYLAQIRFNAKHSIRLSSNLLVQQTSTFYNILHTSVPDHLLSSSNCFYQLTKPREAGAMIWQLGLAFDYTEPKGIDPVSQKLIKPYTTISLPFGKKTLSADFQMANNQKQNAFKTAFTLFKKVSAISDWSMVASYSERLPEEDPNFFLAAWQLKLSPYPPGKTKQLTFDFNYSLNLDKHFKLFYNAGFKQLWGQRSFTPFYIDSFNGFGVYVPPVFYSDKQSSNLINRFNLHSRILRKIVLDFNYLLTLQVSGDRELMLAIPKSKTTLLVSYQLPERFHIWCRLYYQSATIWPDLKLNELSTAQAGELKLPSLFVLDAGVSKKLLKDCLNLNVTLRNLLNGTEKYHPLGAQFDLRLLVSASWNVNPVYALFLLRKKK